MSLENALEDASRLVESYRHRSALAVKSPSGSEFAGAAIGIESSLGTRQRSMSLASEQYRHFRDIVFTAVRPISVRLAAQPIRVGISRKKLNRGSGAKPVAKALAWRIKNFAPNHIKAISEGIDTLESHPITDRLDAPNTMLTSWSNMYMTAASMQLTGAAIWWMIPNVDSDEPNGSGLSAIYYVPRSWATPIHDADKKQAFVSWRIKPPNTTGEGDMVPGHQICYFPLPDPSDPLGVVSPLMAQSKSVTIDGFIQQAQTSSYQNGIRPGIILKAGRMLDADGRDTGRRPVLRPHQRKQLISAIKLANQGVHRHGEPAIIDGLIEDIVPWTTSPSEMDYQQSFNQVKSRIMQGFGVNPISAGEVENANRASAWAADHSLCGNVINPLATLMSQVMTRNIAPWFQKGDEKLYIWIEQCKPISPDDVIGGMEFLSRNGWLRGNEAREFYDLPPYEGGEIIPATVPDHSSSTAEVQRGGGQKP